MVVARRRITAAGSAKKESWKHAHYLFCRPFASIEEGGSHEKSVCVARLVQLKVHVCWEDVSGSRAKFSGHGRSCCRITVMHLEI